MHSSAPMARPCPRGSSRNPCGHTTNPALLAARRPPLPPLRCRRLGPVVVAAAADAPAPPTTSEQRPPSPPPLPRIEFPPSTVVSKADGYDLRLYQPYPVVRTEYEARPPAFLSLGEYLGGANAANARFARPEPAIMRQGFLPGGRKTMELYIGSRRGGPGPGGGGGGEEGEGGGKGGGAGPPAPTDPALSVDVAGGELVAVATFGGNLTREAAEGAHAGLRAALARDGLAAADPEGVYRACQYGAIHSLGERRNEIWVRVQL
jgi:hypothetical protein